MADEDDLQTHVSDREDTMLYRHPVLGESAEGEITDIWGTKLETRVVDAKSDEFSHMLTDGWYRSPTELGVGITAVPTVGETTSSAATKSVVGKDDLDPNAAALEAAEKLAQELGETVKTLTEERDQARAEAIAAAEHAKRLETDLSAEKNLRAASADHIRRLEEEAKQLKAAAKKR